MRHLCCVVGRELALGQPDQTCPKPCLLAEEGTCRVHQHHKPQGQNLHARLGRATTSGGITSAGCVGEGNRSCLHQAVLAVRGAQQKTPSCSTSSGETPRCVGSSEFQPPQCNRWIGMCPRPSRATCACPATNRRRMAIVRCEMWKRCCTAGLSQSRASGIHSP